jgi:hypothetical protein
MDITVTMSLDELEKLKKDNYHRGESFGIEMSITHIYNYLFSSEDRIQLFSDTFHIKKKLEKIMACKNK